jgi:hypothetical protein
MHLRGDDPDEEASGGPDDPLQRNDTQPCPYCRHMIHESSLRCPQCGSYISEEDAPADKPWWVVVGVLVCLGMVVYWILSGS